MSHAYLLVCIGSEIDVGDEEAIYEAVSEQMAPFDENSEFFRDGSRWDWWQIGGRYTGRLGEGSDVLKLSDWDAEACREERRRVVTLNYEEAMGRDDEESREFIYGVKPGESLEQYFDRRLPPDGVIPPPYAFLRGLVWHETDRLGWFGMRAPTECEAKGQDVRRCVTNVSEDAKIVTWKDTDEAWGEKFDKRFISKLSPDDVLVVVDYHV